IGVQIVGGAGASLLFFLLKSFAIRDDFSWCFGLCELRINRYHSLVAAAFLNCSRLDRVDVFSAANSSTTTEKD
ncbi:hypothetical protein DFJ73DRAFT_805339, partial [Zopfochytrium polystomum]